METPRKKAWDFLYSFVKDYLETEEYIFKFQLALSIIIILVFLYYFIFSKSTFKYIICDNCMSEGLFICCREFCPCSCCIYDIYCENGIQYCVCCCCDENSCCYRSSCKNYGSCTFCESLSNQN